MSWFNTKFVRRIGGFTRDASPAPTIQADPPATRVLFSLLGYGRTIETKMPVAADGSPIPWYTYPAIEYFNQWNVRGLRIFEFGSGNSSLFWAHKGARVWSVERDPKWYEIMKSRSAHLEGLFLRQTAAEYAAAIESVGGQFDLIIIDGAWRNECAAAALPHLGAGGVVVLDNSDWYTDVAGFVRSKGFFQVDFNGFGPINEYCWTTSILLPFRSPIGDLIGQPRPIGGIAVSKGDEW